ncbi:Crp/Fnr family transcriptional regulator [Zavarzinia compransoris]|uniref:Crp/Fnr family transcriptional regulator n=1 Tax=Zavarzinia marina TaxID=2911065 RepID=UPI001F157F4E|nr:Crp/Fnr family transcriptional regulator [Zavarzinia marina]MCF4164987.1 Crp/Fnr family transcriptional regulator [Zavarzinia marina]
MDWIEHFPALSALEPAARAILAGRARTRRFPAGTTIVGPGHAPDDMLLLIRGTIRVQQWSEQGREIVLFRAHGGESCVLTAACMLAYQDYDAEAVTETEVEAVALPRAAFEEAIAVSPTFRRFVFTAVSRRMAELFQVIDEIAFRRVDGRLARKLLAMAAADGTVATTHQELAAELRTAREVVSRQLHDFRQRGWVNLGRGAIEVRDRAALGAVAAM